MPVAGETSDSNDVPDAPASELEPEPASPSFTLSLGRSSATGLDREAAAAAFRAGMPRL
jgi:hypothetical protein